MMQGEGLDLVVEAERVAAAVAAMRQHREDAGAQRKGCRALMNLACGDAGMQSIVGAGGVAAVVAAMGLHMEDATVQLYGCGTLGCLAFGDAACKQAVLEGRGVAAVFAAMERHTAEAWVQRWGCLALMNLGMPRAGDADGDVACEQAVVEAAKRGWRLLLGDLAGFGPTPTLPSPDRPPLPQPSAAGPPPDVAAQPDAAQPAAAQPAATLAAPGAAGSRKRGRDGSDTDTHPEQETVSNGQPAAVQPAAALVPAAQITVKEEVTEVVVGTAVCHAAGGKGREKADFRHEFRQIPNKFAIAIVPSFNMGMSGQGMPSSGFWFRAISASNVMQCQYSIIGESGAMDALCLDEIKDRHGLNSLSQLKGLIEERLPDAMRFEGNLLPTSLWIIAHGTPGYVKIGEHTIPVLKFVSLIKEWAGDSLQHVHIEACSSLQGVETHEKEHIKIIKDVIITGYTQKVSLTLTLTLTLTLLPLSQP